MPEPGRAIARWRRVGDFQPRPVRERIFEPAFEDVVREWLVERANSGDDTGLGIRVAATWARCLPPAVPALLVQSGRLTRLGRALTWLIAVGVPGLALLAVLVVQRYGYG